MFVLGLGLWRQDVDNFVHGFGVFVTMVYWWCSKKRGGVDWFLLISLVYLMTVCGWVKGLERFSEEELVVDLNYGCPYSFRDLINPI